MFALPTASLLWAQAGASGPPAWLLPTIRWLGVWGDPSFTIEGPFGPVITFIKIVGLFSLLGWIFAWAMGARRDRNVPKAPWLDVVGLVSVIGLLLAVTLGVLQSTKRIPMVDLGIGLSLPAIVGLPFAIGLLVWVERALWVTIGRLGKRGRPGRPRA